VKSISTVDFKAACLHVIEQMCEDREPMTIAEHGRPLAVLSPVAPAEKTGSIIGAMRGSVLSYDDPFTPATDPAD